MTTAVEVVKLQISRKIVTFLSLEIFVPVHVYDLKSQIERKNHIPRTVIKIWLLSPSAIRLGTRQ